MCLRMSECVWPQRNRNHAPLGGTVGCALPVQGGCRRAQGTARRAKGEEEKNGGDGGAR